MASFKNGFKETYILFGINLDQAVAMGKVLHQANIAEGIEFKETIDGIKAILKTREREQFDTLNRAFVDMYQKWIVSKGGKPLEEVFYECLLNRNLLVSTAESITGGMIASRIINVPGASRIIRKAFVLYDAKAKSEALSIPMSLIECYGEVSLEVVGEMAKNTQMLTKANIVIATSGYAGPTSGSQSERLGEVCLGFAIGDDLTTIKKTFRGSRNQIRKQAVAFALAFVIHYLNQKAQ